MITKTPGARYQGIRRNVAKIREYVARGGGQTRVLAERGLYYDAVRTCLLEISEAATKLGDLAELHEPSVPWRNIRGLGNYLRHQYDELDVRAIEDALNSLENLDAGCARAIAKLAP